MSEERFLIKFSERLNTALGTDETGIWDGEFHTSLAYRQWTGKKKSRILLPVIATFKKRGWGFEIAYSVYVGSDEDFWSYVKVMIPKRTKSMFDSAQRKFLCA
jgi:hypothetical protein